jgi:hypothetical protein
MLASVWFVLGKKIIVTGVGGIGGRQGAFFPASITHWKLSSFSIQQATTTVANNHLY